MKQSIKAVVLLTKQDLYWQLFYHLKRRFIYRAIFALIFSALMVYIAKGAPATTMALVIIASIIGLLVFTYAVDIISYYINAFIINKKSTNKLFEESAEINFFSKYLDVKTKDAQGKFKYKDLRRIFIHKRLNKYTNSHTR